MDVHDVSEAAERHVKTITINNHNNNDDNNNTTTTNNDDNNDDDDDNIAMFWIECYFCKLAVMNVALMRHTNKQTNKQSLCNFLRYSSLVTGQRAKVIITVCWLLSLGIGLTPMLGWNSGEQRLLTFLLSSSLIGGNQVPDDVIDLDLLPVALTFGVVKRCSCAHACI